MKVKEIKVKNIIVKSNLPDGDYVINPYIGCANACLYCYARFMKRFTGHKEEWGDFCDIKINAADLIPAKSSKYKNKDLIIGSVTDPYQKSEARYKLTRQILEKLVALKPRLNILTKSDLVLRDVEVIKKFRKGLVAISFSLLDESLRCKLEPEAATFNQRVNTLKSLHRAGIKTVVFISPLFPFLTDWRVLVSKTKKFVSEYWFENLNIYPSVKDNIYSFLRGVDKELPGKYDEIIKDAKFWQRIENEIRTFCCKERVRYHIYFHHQKIRKNS